MLSFSHLFKALTNYLLPTTTQKEELTAASELDADPVGAPLKTIVDDIDTIYTVEHDEIKIKTSLDALIVLGTSSYEAGERAGTAAGALELSQANETMMELEVERDDLKQLVGRLERVIKRLKSEVAELDSGTMSTRNSKAEK